MTGPQSSRPASSLENQASGRLPAWRLAAFASIAFPSAGMTLPLAIFLPPFYTATLGLGLAEVGLVFMLVRIFDMVTDPLMGILGDRFGSPWGRRRHWLVIALPLMMAGVYMAFMPSGNPGIWYLGFWLLVLYAGTTMKTISHTAWGAELSTDYDERSRIASFSAFAGFFGSLCILLPLAWLQSTGVKPAGRDALAFFGTAVLVLAPICVLMAVTLVGEKPAARKTASIGFFAGLLAVLKNPHMRLLVLADALAAMPGAVMAGLFLFYQSELLGNAQYNSLALIAFYAAHLIGVPFWTRVAMRIGKHPAFGLASLAFCLTTAAFAFPGQGDVALFIFLLFMTGLAHSALAFLIRAMAADVVDYDTLATGSQRTGLYFAVLAITAKLGSAVSIGVTYPLLGQIGFDPTGGNTEETLMWFRAVYVVIPALSMLGAYLTIRSFRLDKSAQRALQAKLGE